MAKALVIHNGSMREEMHLNGFKIYEEREAVLKLFEYWKKHTFGEISYHAGSNQKVGIFHKPSVYIDNEIFIKGDPDTKFNVYWISEKKVSVIEEFLSTSFGSYGGRNKQNLLGKISKGFLKRDLGGNIIVDENWYELKELLTKIDESTFH